MNSESEIKSEEGGQTVGTLAVKRTRRSPALAVALGILCATAYACYFSDDYYWCERRAGINRRGHALCCYVLRTELALRAVAIQRFAQRTGYLPRSLSECASDLIPFDELVAAGLIFQAPKHSVTNRPSATLDLLGLPIIYKRGVQVKEDGSRFRSSDPLPPEVEMYVTDHGGLPTASPEPFVLSDLFLRDRVAQLRSLNWPMTLRLCYLLGGLLFIAIATVLLAVKCSRFGPSTMGRGALEASLLLAMLAGYFYPVVSCYASVGFSPEQFSLEKRLRLLDDAVKRGEVSAKVAQTSRDYLEKLWGSPKLPQARGGGFEK